MLPKKASFATLATKKMQKSTVRLPRSPSAPVTPTYIGERLREWRRSKGKTQIEMAEDIGIDVGTLRKYELGINAPGSVFLGRVYALGVNVNWLLGGAEPMLKEFDPDDLAVAEESIRDLSASLKRLRALDREKFGLLVRGFVARTMEAEHLANLEKRINASLPPQQGNEDIIAYSGTQRTTPRADLLGVDGELPAEDTGV